MQQLFQSPKVSSEELYHCRGAPGASRRMPRRGLLSELWFYRGCEHEEYCSNVAANRAEGSDSPSFVPFPAQASPDPAATPRNQYARPKPHPRPILCGHVLLGAQESSVPACLEWGTSVLHRHGPKHGYLRDMRASKEISSGKGPFKKACDLWVRELARLENVPVAGLQSRTLDKSLASTRATRRDSRTSWEDPRTCMSSCAESARANGEYLEHWRKQGLRAHPRR